MSMGADLSALAGYQIYLFVSIIGPPVHTRIPLFIPIINRLPDIIINVNVNVNVCFSTGKGHYTLDGNRQAVLCCKQ